RQSKVAREAHSDRADAGAAAFLMRLPGKSPQPLRYRTGFICGECTKFGADACVLINRKPFLRACDATVPTEERGHVDGETRIANPSAETRDVRADARHLSH